MEKLELDFTVALLGECTVDSPVSLSGRKYDYVANYVRDDEYIIYDIEMAPDSPARTFTKNELLEKAGPREKIYFDPGEVAAAVVTCGGLCPGLNDVIRALVMALWYRYGVKRIYGFRSGFRGLIERFGLTPMELGPENVLDIHRKGGTVLGSSRGCGDCVDEIIDTLERMKINVLFTIGGDGTQSATLGICRRIRRRGLRIAVVGIPKTIDNDLSFVQKSFGFETAVSKAAEAVAGAHVEAECAINGIGIVKVMGRQSGFIAAHTALAVRDVNYVLIPEVPFELGGENGLLMSLQRRLERRGHAVIVVAEGAGSQLLESADANAEDIGVFIKEIIAAYFEEKNIEVNLKYIDPSYIIRSLPANASDSIYCALLGTNAVHAAMAGRTEMLISLLHGHFVHVPIRMAVSKRNNVDPNGALWRSVLESTGQPPLMKN